MFSREFATKQAPEIADDLLTSHLPGVFQHQERVNGRGPDIFIGTLVFDQTLQCSRIAIVNRTENSAQPLGDCVAGQIERRLAGRAEDFHNERVGTLFPELRQQKERENVEHAILLLGKPPGIFGDGFQYAEQFRRNSFALLDSGPHRPFGETPCVGFQFFQDFRNGHN